MASSAAAGEVVLRLAGITKRFGELVANDAIDLELRRGEVLGLLGENGAGKTTLMSILFGHYTADSGRIEVRGRSLPPGDPAAALAAGIGMVHQHFALAPGLTALDNILLGSQPLLSPWLARTGPRRRIEALMRTAGLEVPLDRPVHALSVGERQRVEILRALDRGASILIMDEPTAVLTPQESESLFQTLRRLAADGMAVVLISHKLGEVMALADRIAVLRGGRKVAERWTDQTDPGELAELMVGHAVDEPVVRPRAPGAPLVVLERVSVRGGHGRPALDDASLALAAGSITGIAGVSGNGQQALAGLLCGTIRPSAGRIVIDGVSWTPSPRAALEARIGRIPEDRHADGVVGDLSLWENLILEDYRKSWLQRWGVVQRRAALESARQTIASYDIRGAGPAAPVRQLSGGNMQKLILARVLERGPRIVVADQPTRGLDVGAVAWVHQRLLMARDRGAAILLISEDLDELRRLADPIVVIHAGRLSEPIPRERADPRRLGLLMAGQADDAARASV